MKLLVSPRDVEEAIAVIRGGADIVDVKNPSEGSLGANFPWVLRAVRELIQRERASVELSAAIGDFVFKPGTASLAALGAAFAGADYVKVGLLVKTSEEAIGLLKAFSKAVKDYDGTKKVVAAFFADFERAGSVSPFLIDEIASAVEIDVAMVDTAVKDGLSSFHFLGEEGMRDFVSAAHELGLKAAVAGSLKFEDIPKVKRSGADILGVRGLVCGGDRESTVKEDLVRKLKTLISE